MSAQLDKSLYGGSGSNTTFLSKLRYGGPNLLKEYGESIFLGPGKGLLDVLKSNEQKSDKSGEPSFLDKLNDFIKGLGKTYGTILGIVVVLLVIVLLLK